jgi:hypothetical protein
MATRTNFFSNFLPKPPQREIPDIPNLLEGVIKDIRGYLPPEAFSLVDKYSEKIDGDTHKIKCQLDADAERGRALACARGKRELNHQLSLQATRCANRPRELKGSSRSVKFKNIERGITTRKTSLKALKLNQGGVERNYQDVNYRINPGESNFEDEFDPNNPDSTIGNKAVLFEADGTVKRTANEISRDASEKEESSKSATDKPVRSTASKNRPRTELRSVNELLKKKKGVGEINSLATLFAAITGLVAIGCLIAVLVPLSFLTVALNWLQTVTTMFTNVRDVTTTYLSMVDGGLSLFGYPKSTAKLKGAIDGIAYGIWGKDNYESAKAAFAKGILNLTSLTKLLEKVEAAKRGTNSKIDSLALGLGAVNDSLKDAGMIPPDSEWSEYSAKVDKFVDAQAKVSPDLKDNIEKLTTEIQTNEETNKEIAEEKEAKDAIAKQRKAEADNLNNLLKDAKPLVDKQIAEAKE